MSNKDRRDENGDSNCTGEVGSMRKSVYIGEDLDSDAKVNKAKGLKMNQSVYR